MQIWYFLHNYQPKKTPKNNWTKAAGICWASEQIRMQMEISLGCNWFKRCSPFPFHSFFFPHHLLSLTLFFSLSQHLQYIQIMGSTDEWISEQSGKKTKRQKEWETLILSFGPPSKRRENNECLLTEAVRRMDQRSWLTLLVISLSSSELWSNTWNTHHSIFFFLMKDLAAQADLEIWIKTKRREFKENDTLTSTKLFTTGTTS